MLKELRLKTNQSNPAAEILSGGLAISMQLSLADGPEPGPGDAAGISYAVSTVVTDAVVGAGYELYQGIKGFGDPSKWHTTYEPPSQNPIHNRPKGYDNKKSPFRLEWFSKMGAYRFKRA